MATPDPVYVHGFSVANFLRAEIVEIQLDGSGLTIVSGNNAEGKSSILKAIWAALGGRDALPEQPVRNGAKEAEVTVDLGDKIVRLRVKADRATTLTVETKDGMRAKSPQTLLDDLVGKLGLGFDPLAFAAMEPRDQATTLRQLVGLDMSALDGEAAKVYAERTQVNREAKLLDGQLAGLLIPPEPVAPPAVEVPEEIDIAALAERQSVALAEKAGNDQKRRYLADQEVHAAQLARQVESIEADLVELKERLEETRRQHASALATARDERTLVEALADPNTADLAQQIADAKGRNAAARRASEGARALVESHKRAVADRARALASREAKATEVAAKKSEADRHSSRLAEIDAQKSAALAACTFPLDGLSVDGDVVTFDGIPLSQASSAEQLRVCLGIAAALNPRLRLILVRQGNDLDANRLRQVAEWAAANQYQVLLERVGSNVPASIEIVAGRVARDSRKRAEGEAA